MERVSCTPGSVNTTNMHQGMIKPTHSDWVERMFARTLRGMLNRNFHSVRLYGPLPMLRSHAPVLLLPNHGTWWDGFLVHLLNRLVLQRTLYVLMLEKQLRRYPFFRRLGGYGFNPDNRRDAATALRYTLELLENQRDSVVCLFPQGDLTPVEKRPLGTRPGAGWLIRNSTRPLNVLPLAIRIDSFKFQYPDVSLSFGDPMLFEAEERVPDRDLEAALEATLDRLTSALYQDGPPLEPVRDLIRGRQSVNERFLSVRNLFGARGEK